MKKEKMTFRATDLEELFYSRKIAEDMGYEQISLKQNSKNEWILKMKLKNTQGIK